MILGSTPWGATATVIGGSSPIRGSGGQDRL
jgi:hypothetical protein